MLFTFLFYIVLVIVRPQEYLESLAGLNLLRYLVLVAFFLWMLKSPKYLSAPQQWLVPAFCALAVLSRVAMGWFGGAGLALQELGPLAMLFFVCAAAAEQPKSLSLALKVMCLSSLVLVFHGIYQITHDGESWTGQLMEGWIDGRRVQYIGPFYDPNDLAMLFVVCFPLAFYLAWETGNKLLKLLWIATAAMFAYGVFLTNSRGGLLAIIATAAMWSMRRMGTIATAIVAAVGLPTLFAATRLAGMSSDEESAAGRVDAWYTALQLFISRPLTGIGMGLFTDHNTLTAHNSWLLVLAEDGIFGYLAWFLLVGFSIQQMYVIGHHAEVAPDGTTQIVPVVGESRTQALAIAMYYASIGLLVSAFFLSRSYEFLMFLYWGFCAGLYNGARARDQEVPAVDTRHFGRKWASAGLLSLPVFYVLVRILLIVQHD